jgi:hypothetical protein
MIAFLISAGLDSARMLAYSIAFVAPFMLYPRTRRVIITSARFTKRHSPRWAGALFVVAGIIPGQADEIALVAILLIPILRNRLQRQTFARLVRYAWEYQS